MAKVQEILNLLGADPDRGRTPVLLPIEARQKGPKIPGWNEKSWADMERGDYLAQIEAHPNTGVLLGDPSGGLATLDFDHEHLVEPFLDVNPSLRQSLRTRGQKGCQIWFWMQRDPRLEELGLRSWPVKRYNVNHRTEAIEDPQPDGKVKRTPIVAVEWRGGGSVQSVIRGVHPAGMDYQVVNEARPLSLRFRDIVWPKWVERPWEMEWFKALEEQFGASMVETEQGLSLTDHFWAGRFKLFHDYLYEPEEKAFYGYNGVSGAWELRTTQQVRNAVSADVLQYARDAQKALLETNVGRSLARVSAITAFLEGEVTRRKAFERPPGIVHLANGVLDLGADTLELKPFSPEFMSRNPVPWAYDPAATCPRFQSELLERALDLDDISLLQRCAGALLLGQNIMQRIVILTGTAGGGKSTLVDVLQRLIGEHNVANLRTHLLDERFELEGYIGKNMLSAADVRGDFLMKSSAAMLKSLTGGDFLEAELKGGKRIRIKGNFNVWITCNSRLTVRMEEDSDAWRRRLVIIRYERPKPERPVPGFAELLMREEGSGILNWAIKGAQDLLEASKLVGKLVMTKGQLDRVETLLAESESVGHFIERCVEPVDKELKETVTTDELLHAYREYCASQGWNALPDSAFMNKARDAMLRVHRVSMSNDIRREFKGVAKTKRGYRHVRLLWDGGEEEQDET